MISERGPVTRSRAREILHDLEACEVEAAENPTPQVLVNLGWARADARMWPDLISGEELDLILRGNYTPKPVAESEIRLLRQYADEEGE